MRRDLPFIVCLLLLTAVVYAQVRRFEFINLDDPTYVTDNPAVRAGLKLDSIVWAFTSCEKSANWHPLTWLSLMVDTQLFGSGSSGDFHVTNAVFHAANTVLLYLALSRMTLSRGRSALVAALFAVHPLHVESVAWISERKDVLSTFFGFLSWWLYAKYLQGRGLIPPDPADEARAVFTPQRTSMFYMLSLLAFVGSLMSKQMLVTWPCVLLLFDLWPLKRLDREPWPRLVLEKWPFFAVSIVFCIIVAVAQRVGGAVRTLGEYPLWVRVGNAVVSYALYLQKTFWPLRLGVFYPHPHKSLPASEIVVASVILILITVACWRLRKSAPVWLMGWLWFVGTLVPVIGLVQVGNQQLADRYMYIPLVGLSVAVVWGVADWIGSNRAWQMAAGCLAGCAVLACTGLAYQQTSVWRNSVLLFGHTIDVTGQNIVAELSLGHGLLNDGRFREAVPHYQRATELNSDSFVSWNCLGDAYFELDDLSEAEKAYQRAKAINPKIVETWINFARLHAALHRDDLADEDLNHALALEAENPFVHFQLGKLRRRQNRLAEARQHLNVTLKFLPDYPRALDELRKMEQ